MNNTMSVFRQYGPAIQYMTEVHYRWFAASFIGHRELITFPIDSNGDPPGLWQFIVHLTMNVGHYNMP